MTRYAIDHLTAIRIVREGTTVHADHRLVAPSLLRSQALSHLYRAARDGSLDPAEARRALDGIATMRVRLLGDRVSRATAWRVAEQFGWGDTTEAEYVAVAQLQADAFITLDERLAKELERARAVPTAPFDALLAATPPT